MVKKALLFKKTQKQKLIGLFLYLQRAIISSLSLQPNNGLLQEPK